MEGEIEVNKASKQAWRERNPKYSEVLRERVPNREVRRDRDPTYEEVQREGIPGFGTATPKAEPLTPIEVRIRNNLSTRIRAELNRKGARKSRMTIPLLDCSIPRLMLHLENKFEIGMSWENYGEWEIDHIVPCAMFDLTKGEHQKRCFHFTNLQPLWQPVNASKGAKLFNEEGLLRL